MKKYQRIVATAVVTTGVFLSGTIVQAQYDWLNPLLNDAVVKINGKAKTKSDQLVNNLQNGMGDLMKDRAQPEISTLQSQVDAELDAYYQQKLTTLDNTSEYQTVSKNLQIIKQQAVEQYKKRIDDAFNGVGSH